MELSVRVEATVNEKRRFLGYPDITPLVELASLAMDDLMMLVVEARLAALEHNLDEAEPGPLEAGGAERH